jgi:carboxypeptidase PM20D1
VKKLLALLGLGVVLSAGLIVARTARHGSPQPSVHPVPEVAVPDGAAERLAGAVRIPTISFEDPSSLDGEAFDSLRSYLERVFPLVHARLRREIVATHSLLFTWLGSDSTLKPILLIGHMDVVPVEAGTEKQWQEEPFGGRVSDGFVWGRGAIDNKSTVVGTLEAVELLLRESFRPKRTVYLGYGHDEEVGGMRGGREIAALLQSRGVKLEAVLDEGGVIGDGLLPGVSAPVAMVGIAEKGFVSVELSTRVPGGHSSLPPSQSAIGIISAAVARLESNQMPARLDGPTKLFLDRVSPSFPFLRRALFANLWLTRALVMRNLEQSPTTNAMVRTTTAATVFQAGTKDNVLPSYARAVINFRIAPSDSIAGVVEHVRRTIDDSRVEVNVVGRFSSEPSAVSSRESESYLALERTIRRVTPNTIVAPYLVVVVTDARHYAGLTDNVFRFLPLRLTQRDLQRMHGTDERIAITDYEQAIRTYRQFILEAGGEPLR